MSSKTFKVVKFETMRQIKRPSFWIAILAMPVLLCGALLISFIVGGPSEGVHLDDDTTVAITDEAGILPEENPFGLYQDKASGIQAVKDKKVDLFFYIPADFKDSKKAELYHISEGLGLFDNYSEVLKKILSESAKQNIPEAEIVALTGDYAVDDTKFTPDGTESNVLGKAIIPGIFLLGFFVFICAFGNRMLMTVVEEKENRVSEMILTSISAKHLIVGKIIALLLLGAIQILTFIIPIIALVIINSNNEIVSTILNMVVIEPFGIIVCSLIFLFSILLYAGACTFIGAITPTAKDASQFFGPIIIGLMLPLYFTQAFLAGETNGIIEFLTYFPLSAPMALLLRYGVGSIDTIGIIIGVVELVILSIILIYFSVVSFQKNAINFSIALPKFSLKKSSK